MEPAVLRQKQEARKLNLQAAALTPLYALAFLPLLFFSKVSEAVQVELVILQFAIITGAGVAMAVLLLMAISVKFQIVGDGKDMKIFSRKDKLKYMGFGWTLMAAMVLLFGFLSGHL